MSDARLQRLGLGVRELRKVGESEPAEPASDERGPQDFQPRMLRRPSPPLQNLVPVSTGCMPRYDTLFSHLRFGAHPAEVKNGVAGMDDRMHPRVSGVCRISVPGFHVYSVGRDALGLSGEAELRAGAYDERSRLRSLSRPPPSARLEKAA